MEATARIADNQLALQAGWSEELLAEEPGWLRDESFELGLVGLDASELERLLSIAGGEPNVPEPPSAPVSKPGNLWPHRSLKYRRALPG